MAEELSNPTKREVRKGSNFMIAKLLKGLSPPSQIFLRAEKPLPAAHPKATDLFKSKSYKKNNEF